MSEEWAKRLLCPDGSCVGVIGPDGRCNACGKTAASAGDEAGGGVSVTAHDAIASQASLPATTTGEAGAVAIGDDHDQPDDDEAGPSEQADSSERAAAPAAGATTDDWDRRQLCSDGACVGVIAEGKCTVCGRSPA
jgi:hypothetical protein